MKTILLLALMIVSITANSQYCSATNAGGNNIENFSTTNGLTTNITNNNSGGGSFPNYTDYTSMSVDQLIGDTIFFNIQSGSSGSLYYSIWIDWNQDQDFNDIGENVWTTNYNTFSMLSDTIIVPMTALNGTTRMRVRSQWDVTPTDPCGLFPAGEVEDYSITIITDPCVGVDPPDLSIINTTGEFCVGDIATANLVNSAYYSSIVWSDGNGNNVDNTNLGEGSFEVDATLGICTYTETFSTTLISVNSPSLFGNTTIICPDQTIIVGINNAGDYTNIGWYDNVGNVVDPSTGLDTGDYVFIGNQSICSITENFTITGYNINTTLSTSDVSLCYGASAVIITTGGATTNYYDVGGSVVDPNSVSTGDYYGTGLTVDGCQYTTNIITITQDNCWVGIDESELNQQPISVVYFSLNGQEVNKTETGVLIKISTYNSGVVSEKTVNLIK